MSATPLIDEHIGDVYDEHMVTTAARLVSEGENPEYDRGVTELLCDLIDVPHAEKSVLLAELRKIAARPDQLYELGDDEA